MRHLCLLLPLAACSPGDDCVPPTGQGFLQLTLGGEELASAASWSVPVTWSACGEELGEGLQSRRIESWVVPAGTLEIAASDGTWGGGTSGAIGGEGCAGTLLVTVPPGGSADETIELDCD